MRSNRNWVEEICTDPDDFGLVLEAYDYFCMEYETLRAELSLEKVRGSRLTEMSIKMPSYTDHIQSNWSEIVAISDHLGTLITAATQKARKKYIENYNRELGSHQVKDYAEAEPEVLQIRQILLRIEMIRNKMEGLSKAAERLHFQIGNLIRLKEAGLDEMCIN
jgi:uncharacterized protein YmfQ (DUF2313 family)